MHCPICLEAFKLPIVQCTSGHSFCRSCIDEWLLRKKTCPLDNGSLDKHNLVRNLSLEAIMSDRKPISKGKGGMSTKPQRHPRIHNSSRHWGLYVAIFSVLVLSTALVFNRTSQPSYPPSAPPSTPHHSPPSATPHYSPPIKPQPKPTTIHQPTDYPPKKLPFSSLLYQFCEHCIDFLTNVVTFIYNFCSEVLHDVFKFLVLVKDDIVKFIGNILNWNWTAFFKTIIKCTKLFGSFLYMLAFTFYNVAVFAAVCGFYICSTLTKGCILMLHFGASLVLHITEYIGVI